MSNSSALSGAHCLQDSNHPSRGDREANILGIEVEGSLKLRNENSHSQLLQLGGRAEDTCTSGGRDKPATRPDSHTPRLKRIKEPDGTNDCPRRLYRN